MAQAELGCFLELGWPLPTRVLDLYADFKIISNGLHSVGGKGLLGAMSWYSIPGLSKEEKKSNRDLVLRGGPWTHSEQQEMTAAFRANHPVRRHRVCSDKKCTDFDDFGLARPLLAVGTCYLHIGYLPVPWRTKGPGQSGETPQLPGKNCVLGLVGAGLV